QFLSAITLVVDIIGEERLLTTSKSLGRPGLGHYVLHRLIGGSLKGHFFRWLAAVGIVASILGPAPATRLAAASGPLRRRHPHRRAVAHARADRGPRVGLRTRQGALHRQW